MKEGRKIMRNCSTCFWYYNEPDDLMIEDDFSDYTNITNGHCIFQRNEENQDFYSPCAYPVGMQSVPKIFYDQEYLGPGYFIVYSDRKNMERFLKFYLLEDENVKTFALRAYERGSIDQPHQGFRSICFPIDCEEPLYKVVKPFQEKILGKWIFSLDKFNQGQNNFQLVKKCEKLVLIVNKDVYGGKEKTNFIDILIGDSLSCQYYPEFLNFYNQLQTISSGTMKKEKLQKILTMKKF